LMHGLTHPKFKGGTFGKKSVPQKTLLIAFP